MENETIAESFNKALLKILSENQVEVFERHKNSPPNKKVIGILSCNGCKRKHRFYQDGTQKLEEHESDCPYKDVPIDET